MHFLKQFFTWWSGQTLATRFFTWRKGEHVGTDQAGEIGLVRLLPLTVRGIG